MNIPFVSFEYMHKPLKAEMMHAFEDFYDSSWYILGDKVKNFESEYSSFNKVLFTIGVSNGLDAIFLSLKALEIGPGDEVIVPSNTYIATWLAIGYTGAKIIPVEPCVNTYNINVHIVESLINSNTRAILPVHLYGQACDMDTICNIAKRHGLHVVEDNAQSQGAIWGNQLTGSFGDINATSFYPGKNLGALGDAGAVTTNSAILNEKVRALRNYGSVVKYQNDIIGYNMRLDECQAAFLSIKMKYLDTWITQRRQVASWYDKALKGVGDIITPEIAKNASHVYHLYVIRTKYRDQLSDYLNSRHIGTLIHYPIPPHLQKGFSHLNFGKGALPIAEELSKTCLSLPIWPGLKESDVEYIVDSIKKFFQNEL